MCRPDSERHRSCSGRLRHRTFAQGMILLFSAMSYCSVPAVLHLRYLHEALQTGHLGSTEASCRVLTCQGQEAALWTIQSTAFFLIALECLDCPLEGQTDHTCAALSSPHGLPQKPFLSLGSTGCRQCGREWREALTEPQARREAAVHRLAAAHAEDDALNAPHRALPLARKSEWCASPQASAAHLCKSDLRAG